MWHHPDWLGRYFPDVGLGVYSTWCLAVEGNTTFYATPTSATARRWAADVPGEFRFLFKLPRGITHDRRLRNAETETGEFFATMSPLAEVMGPTQIQLPGSFGPADLATLARFLADAPDPPNGWAVELRHPAFGPGGSHERAVNDVLADLGADRVLLDTRSVFSVPPVTPAEHEAWERKPRIGVRPVATGVQPVVRFIGQTDLDGAKADAAPWVTKVAQWLETGLEPTVFLHTPDNVDCLALCRWFHDAVAERAGAEVEPQPDPAMPDTQLGLWTQS